MSPRPRQTERVDFGSDELGLILPYMVRLADAGDGWINLIPKFGDEDEPTSLRFFTLFGGGSTGSTMCTWIPGRRDHGVPTSANLGITHVTGRRAVAQLQSLAISIPDRWFVEQDHPRRGLVLRVPFDEPDEEVIRWGMRAVSALSAPRTPPTRSWRADVYLPAAG